MHIEHSQLYQTLSEFNDAKMDKTISTIHLDLHSSLYVSITEFTL